MSLRGGIFLIPTKQSPSGVGDCFGPRKYAEQERPRNDITIINYDRTSSQTHKRRLAA